jgi:hypothetical protein
MQFFRDDTRYLLENWSKYREVTETRRRLDEDFNAMMEALAGDVLKQPPWNDGTWRTDPELGIWLARQSWPVSAGNRDNWVCVGLYVPNIDAIVDASGNNRWGGNVIAPADAIKPKEIERVLRPVIESDDAWRDYEVWWGEEEVIWKRLPTLLGENFIRDFRKIVDAELTQIAKLIPVIDDLAASTTG